MKENRIVATQLSALVQGGVGVIIEKTESIRSKNYAYVLNNRGQNECKQSHCGKHGCNALTVRN